MNKKKQETYLCMIAALIFIAIIIMNLLLSPTQAKSQVEPAQEKGLELPAGGTWFVTPVPEVKQNSVKQTEQETFRTIPKCPWSEKTQRKIKKICEEYYISFSLIMSMAYEESRFDEAAIGDGGQAVGAWQIHPSTWGSVIKKLGYTNSDMKKPVPASEVTCYIMTAHFEKVNEVYYALMAWNGGGAYAMKKLENGEVSKYARRIEERSRRYEQRSKSGRAGTAAKSVKSGK